MNAEQARERAKAIAAKSPHIESLYFDHSFSPPKAYLVEASLYPTFQWWSTPYNFPENKTCGVKVKISEGFFDRHETIKL